MMRPTLFLPVAFGLIFAHGLIAQTTSTEVLGTVIDSTGAVVPGATITLLRTQTGEKREAKTDSSGNYSFPLIEIGSRSINRPNGMNSR